MFYIFRAPKHGDFQVHTVPVNFVRWLNHIEYSQVSKSAPASVCPIAHVLGFKLLEPHQHRMNKHCLTVQAAGASLRRDRLSWK